ncbi:hypothetical protein MARLIPOL_11920 [Marinobacter lipolyticus SM19]|uniref:Bacterial virulence factor lipase N-terminal domain-containing protein n=1 Tax=Marinobacter lipolyticus SM19 TaxID=1318628 RepID=R8AZR6_9GAMM|nr:hypothetical protein [Marinobacter lipolyticus]EON91797.1 hypothetical protein MARLIPOL_11920 [Marinobacter lipolyticus SM19]
MFKKTLISLAVASSLGLTGCFDSASSGKNANPEYKINNPAIDGKTWPVFNPLLSQLPIPNDLIFDSEQGDGTFGVNDSSPPVTTALNELSGASTVAPAVIQFNGQIDPGTVVYGETVFLLELEYASGDPLQGLSIGEPPTVVGPAPARADVETLDGTSAIRILPLQPLNPRKRYVAVVTKDITDINGENIIASPSYSNLTDEEQPLGNDGLAPVRTLINSLWEPIAGAALGITDDNIAVSYSFTTSNDEKVLQYIAEPAAWFSDQIETFVKVSAAGSALEGGASSYEEVVPVVDGAFTNFPNIPASDGELIASKLPTLFGSGAPCEGTTGEIAVTCAGVALATSFSPLLPDQSDRTAADITVDPASVAPVPFVSAVTSGILDAFGAASTDVTAAQGTVSLPYYLGTSGADLVTKSWVADDELATQLNTAFESIGLAIPQADPSVSTAVNYVFPFPKEQATVEVPMLALYPTDGSTLQGVVLYQHGITTDRSAALTFGTALAANGYAVIAVDQPLHGVAAFTAEEQEALADQLLTGAGLEVNDTNRTALINGQLSLGFLQQLIDGGCSVSTVEEVLGGACGAEAATAMAGLVSIENTVANAGSTIPGLAPQIGNERHFGFYAEQPGVPGAIDFDNGIGDSGSLYINLTSFLTTRDNGRQSAVDQMNLRESVSGLVLPTGGTNVTIDDTTPVYFVGHSLGTITGTPFVAAVNANQSAALNPGASSNDINAASMLTPGGGITRLLENSPTFAPRILLGLQQAAGLAQGDASLETYLNVFQATIDTADPINFVDNLADFGTPVLLSEVEGDTVIPNAADAAEWGVPALEGVFTTEVNGQDVPVTVDSFNAPLAGTKPLTLGLTNITTYTSGNHGTPVSADDAAVFGGMVTGTVGLFMANP